MRIELVSQPDAIARWQELVDDPELARLPYRIETDRFGRTIMSPPPAYSHASYIGKIIKLLNRLLPDGQAMAETPVLTADGIKMPVATWISAVYFGELEAKKFRLGNPLC
jgi:hypothetical protein